ncbi:type II toxin-antitoxin system HipA family toxin [bacterium]|nr:type II toxin-antitoxin system HipA family toxin [bacterium]
MARTLDVYLHQELVGQLIQDDHGQLLFDYAGGWLENPKAVPLSHSLPLRPERFSPNECRGFFAGILPEAGKREMIARNLGISARNDFAMLERIGGECAGAVTFIPEGEALPVLDYHYRELTEKELADILLKLPRRPLMAGEEGVRLSLAGAQDKIAVHVADGKFSVPLGGAPSTHILKPAIERFEGVVFNEAYCLQLAAAVDIPVAVTGIHQVESIDCLLVERYDRTHDDAGNVHRLHQEDFCQALGIVSEIKYQSEGGPGLSQSMGLLRAVSTTPVIDLQRLLDAVIFNFLIGNNDAHGKNFSLLYRGKETRLAPLYDVLSTAYYPELATRMAMPIGGEYAANRIFPRHFERLAAEAGLGKALVKGRVPELAESVLDSLDKVDKQHPVAEKLAEMIGGHCRSVLERFGKA